jgi:hypothetical protein
VDIGQFLQSADHLEQIVGARIAFVAEHAHQAFRWNANLGSQCLEAYRGVDIGSQDRLSRGDIARDQQVKGFDQQAPTKFGILFGTKLDDEVIGQRNVAIGAVQGVLAGAPVLDPVADARICWVTRDDLAAATAAVLLADEPEDVYELTGPPRSYRELAAARPDVIHLEVGEPDFGTPEHIITAAFAAVSAGAKLSVSRSAARCASRRLYPRSRSEDDGSG